MADTGPTANTILKILGGTQAGAEVSLAKGEYVLGSGPDDEIQIIDVSLKPGHLRLRVAPGKIEIRGGAGALRTLNGIALDAASEWQEIEPLDIVTAGTTRFALGPPTAQWASIADAETDDRSSPRPTVRKPAGAPPAIADWLPKGRQLAIPLAALALLVVFAIWQLSSTKIQSNAGRMNELSELELLRNGIAQLPFAKDVSVRQDVDLTLFVNGYVETPVERRAVIGVVEKSGIPARIRVSVLQSIRSEIDNLIRSEQVNVTATVTRNGELGLDGVILNEAAANRFVELAKDRILGISRIDSRIKTAKSLLADVEKLAQVSQISSWVLLRNDANLIEATGAIPIEKIDSWVGFLQAYARRFAKDIGLRSFVQLQNANGPTVAGGGSIIIGGSGERADATALDVDRLQQGLYGSSDVLVGGKPTVVAQADVATSPSRSPISRRDAPLAPIVVSPASPPSAPPRSAVSPLVPPPPATTNVPTQPAPTQPRFGADLTERTRNILLQWRDDKLGTNSDAQVIGRALDALASGAGNSQTSAEGRHQMAERYLPLFATKYTGTSESCWDDSHLTPGNSQAALLWLDILSVSETMTLRSFDSEMQALLLEAALNPRRLTECAKKTTAARPQSSYLDEINRNPDFVRFITRDLPPFSLDITGASVGQNARFVQIRSGRKYLEGAAPDRSSRLALVGELGVAIQLKEGLSSVIFSPDMTWLSD